MFSYISSNGRDIKTGHIQYSKYGGTQGWLFYQKAKSKPGTSSKNLQSLPELHKINFLKEWVCPFYQFYFIQADFKHLNSEEEQKN